MAPEVCGEKPLENKPFYSAYWTDKNKFRWTFDELASMAPPGWKEILKDLTDKLFYLGWDGGVSQVKEKFGTLRFYEGGLFPSRMASDIAFDVIQQAEWKSGQTCQNCGGWGKLRGTGWVTTLCTKCAVKENYPLEDWETCADSQATQDPPSL